MADDLFTAQENYSSSSSSWPKIPKDVLQDLCSRFLINIPENEKNDMVRICFQIELAHWYYIDFCRQDDPDLPPCGMKDFIFIIFSEFSFLNKTRQPIQTIYENWKKYKVRVPVFGAILLDETLEKCLLVQGFHSKTSWGFPKGKVNKDEGDLDCAKREVWEEVGYDISEFARGDQFLENNIHDHQVRLYIVPGVDQYYNFKPNTRGEIKEIKWFNVHHLPTHKKDSTPKEEIGLMANNFFMIHSFVKPLRKWISDKKNTMSNFPVLASPMSYLNNSPANKKLDEKKELLKKQRREKEEDEYRKKNVLMPHLPGSEEENTLKTMLGMKGTLGSSTSQPDAIRKLLTGTVGVSPKVTPEKPSKKNPNASGGYYSTQGYSFKDDISRSGNKKEYSTQGYSVKDDINRSGNKKEYSTQGYSVKDDINRSGNKKEQSRHPNHMESYAQKASKGTPSQQKSATPTQRHPPGFERLPPGRNSPFKYQQQQQQLQHRSSPHDYSSNIRSPSNYHQQQHYPSTPSSARKLTYPTETQLPSDSKQGRDNKQGRSKNSNCLSDFSFNSSAFANFRFNKEQILAVLI